MTQIQQQPGTKLPWLVEGPDYFGDYDLLHNADSLAVGVVVSNMRPPEEVAANARYIVTAANAYPKLLAQRDELVAALEGLVRYAEAVRASAGMGKNQLARLEAAKAALANARQGKEG